MDCFSVPTSVAGLVGLIVGSLLIYFLHQTFYLAGPHCDLQLLYVPALDLSETTSNSNSTATATNPFLFFDLSLQNILAYHGISYGDVNLTFSYGHKPVAKYVVPGFYQGRLKTAQRRDVVETSGMPWADAVAAVSSGSKAVFRVELEARPRFKILLWDTDPKDVKIAADVEVDGGGLKAAKDEIRLKSSAASSSRRGGNGMGVFVTVIAVLIASHLL